MALASAQSEASETEDLQDLCSAVGPAMAQSVSGVFGCLSCPTVRGQRRRSLSERRFVRHELKEGEGVCDASSGGSAAVVLPRVRLGVASDPENVKSPLGDFQTSDGPPHPPHSVHPSALRVCFSDISQGLFSTTTLSPPRLPRRRRERRVFMFEAPFVKVRSLLSSEESITSTASLYVLHRPRGDLRKYAYTTI